MKLIKSPLKNALYDSIDDLEQSLRIKTKSKSSYRAKSRMIKDTLDSFSKDTSDIFDKVFEDSMMGPDFIEEIQEISEKLSQTDRMIAGNQVLLRALNKCSNIEEVDDLAHNFHYEGYFDYDSRLQKNAPSKLQEIGTITPNNQNEIELASSSNPIKMQPTNMKGIANEYTSNLMKSGTGFIARRFKQTNKNRNRLSGTDTRYQVTNIPMEDEEDLNDQENIGVIPHVSKKSGYSKLRDNSTPLRSRRFGLRRGKYNETVG